MKSNWLVRFTRPLKVVVPDPATCWRLAAVIATAVTSFADVIVIAPSRVPPTTPPKTMLPSPAIRPRVCGPSIVLLKLMLFPPPTETVFIKMPLVKVTALSNEITSSVVVMLPPRKLVPVPPLFTCANAPPVLMFAPLAVVNRPALVTVIVVPTTLLPTPFIVRLFPVNANWFVRSAVLLKRVVPVPADCVKLDARIAAGTTIVPTETFVAEETVIAPRRFPNPTAPVNKTLPVPAVRPKSNGPLSVLRKLISPTPAPVVTSTLPLNVVAEL